MFSDADSKQPDTTTTNLTQDVAMISQNQAIDCKGQEDLEDKGGEESTNLPQVSKFVEGNIDEIGKEEEDYGLCQEEIDQINNNLKMQAETNNHDVIMN